MIITIDGPAGSGKSTISRLLASRLGIAYLDTGATYRAVTYQAMRKSTEMGNAAAMARLASETNIRLVPHNDAVKIFIDGEDVSAQIRTPEVTRNVKYAANAAEVRDVLVKLQRKIAAQLGSCVCEGRDQGTVVFPDADFKIYLDASCEERARRRTAELAEKGHNEKFENVLADIEKRDRADMSRDVGPLVKPKDAYVLDSSDKTIEQVVHEIFNLVSNK